MKIAILTIGTRGDTQPFIALAQRLQRAGFKVTLGAPPDFIVYKNAVLAAFSAAQKLSIPCMVLGIAFNFSS